MKAAAKITDPLRCVERLLGASGPEIRRLAARDSAVAASAAAAASGASQLAVPSSSFGASAGCTLRLGRLIVGGALVDEPLRVDLKALAAALPSHVVACLLSGGDNFEEEQGQGRGGDVEEVKKEATPPVTDAPIPLPAPGGATASSSLASSVPSSSSAFARWCSGLTSVKVSASCSADHASRALRLLAAIAHAADASPGVFAGLAEVTDDGAVVALDAGSGGGGGGGSNASAAASARKKQKTVAAASATAAAAAASAASKRRANPFRVGLLDALALSVCAVASSCGGGGGGEEEEEGGSRGAAGGLLAAAASPVAADRERALAWVSLVPAALDAAFSCLAPRVPDPQLQGQQQGQNQLQNQALRYSVLEDPDARAEGRCARGAGVSEGLRGRPWSCRRRPRRGARDQGRLEAWKREAISCCSSAGNPSGRRAAALADSVAALAHAAGAGLEELGKALSVPLFYAGFASRDPTLAGLVRCVSEAVALAPAGFEAAEHERRASRSRGAATIGGEDEGEAGEMLLLPFAARTALDLLAARGLALFVALSETPEPPFLDVIFQGGKGAEEGEGKQKQAKKKNDAAETKRKHQSSSIRRAAIFAADAALEAAGRALRRPPISAASPATSAGEGHLASAALAAAELLTDDSNHRACAAELLAPALAEALSAPAAAFASSWCCGSDGAARHEKDAVSSAADGSTAAALVLAPPTPDAVARALTLARVVEVLRPALVAKAAEAARAAAAAAARDAASASAPSAPQRDSARVEREKVAAAARGATSSAGRCLALFKILGNMQVDGGEGEGEGEGKEGRDPAARKLVRELVRRELAKKRRSDSPSSSSSFEAVTASGASTAALINLRALSAAAARLRRAAERGAAADAAANVDGGGAFTWYADDLLTRGEQGLLDALDEAVGRCAAEVDRAVVDAGAGAGGRAGDCSGVHAEVVEMLRGQKK